jgi:hypothetical protein
LGFICEVFDPFGIAEDDLKQSPHFTPFDLNPVPDFVLADPLALSALSASLPRPPTPPTAGEIDVFNFVSRNLI